MIINSGNLDILFTGFKAAFQGAFTGANTFHKNVALTVPSSTATEKYGWLGQMPQLREWLGPRVVKNLVAHSYAIENLDFESTVSVPRNAIEDDRYGIYTPFFAELGRAAAEHPDVLISQLIADGFNTLCYDGQNFFDTDHPVRLNGSDKPPVSVSNMQAGTDEAWYLLDCSRPIKPFIFQERRAYDLVSKDRPGDDNVFFNKEYVYGVDARANAGYGLWQLAYASKQPLTAENYELARAAMMKQRGDEGRPLGIKPDTLVCGPNLEGAAMRLLNNGTRVVMVEGSDSATLPIAIQNEWANTATPIVTPWMNAA